MSAVTGDLLSAASFLAAMVGLLYTAWYPDIAKAANTTSDLRDEQKIEKVRAALRTRALPLAAIAIGLVLLLFWTAVQVMEGVVKNAVHSTDGAYDPVKACYVAIVLVLGVLAATSATAAYGVRKALRTLEGLPRS